MLNLKIEEGITVNIWTSEKNTALPGANVGHVSIETPYMYMSLWPMPRQSSEQISSSELSKLGRFKRQWQSYFDNRQPTYMPNYQQDILSEGLSEGDFIQIQHINECQVDQIPVLFNLETNEMQIIKEQPEGKISENEFLLAVTPCQANVRLTFYSLSQGAMHKEFNDLKDKLEGWRLIGSNVIMRATSSGPVENCASLAFRLLQAGGLSVLLNTEVKISMHSETSSFVKPDVLVKYLIRAKAQEQIKYPETESYHKEGDSDLDQLKQALGMQSKDHLTPQATRPFRLSFK